MKRTQLGILIFLIAGALASAQTSSPTQTTDSKPAGSSSPTAAGGQTGDQSQTGAEKRTANQGADDKDNASGTSKDRLFFALPNFLTLENAKNVPSLTTGGKFKVVARGSFDPIQAVWYGALSGISQAEDSEPGFGQGAQGYGKRYGAYAADGTIENFFVGAIFPSLLKQDPRYFQSGHGGFGSRAGYAVSRTFWTRTDSGHGQFNYSEIFGSALASAVSTYSYHPHPGYHPVPGKNVRYIASDRTLTNTASVWGTQVGYDTLTLVIKEFWPDVRRKIKKKHNE